MRRTKFIPREVPEPHPAGMASAKIVACDLMLCRAGDNRRRCEVVRAPAAARKAIDQRIVLPDHIVEPGDRDGRRAQAGQRLCQRKRLVGRAVKDRDAGARQTEWQVRRMLAQQRVEPGCRLCRQRGPHLAGEACILLGGDAAEDRSRRNPVCSRLQPARSEATRLA